MFVCVCLWVSGLPHLGAFPLAGVRGGPLCVHEHVPWFWEGTRGETLPQNGTERLHAP